MAGTSLVYAGPGSEFYRPNWGAPYSPAPGTVPPTASQLLSSGRGMVSNVAKTAGRVAPIVGFAAMPEEDKVKAATALNPGLGLVTALGTGIRNYIGSKLGFSGKQEAPAAVKPPSAVAPVSPAAVKPPSAAAPVPPAAEGASDDQFNSVINDQQRQLQPSVNDAHVDAMFRAADAQQLPGATREGVLGAMRVSPGNYSNLGAGYVDYAQKHSGMVDPFSAPSGGAQDGVAQLHAQAQALAGGSFGDLAKARLLMSQARNSLSQQNAAAQNTTHLQGISLQNAGNLLGIGMTTGSQEGIHSASDKAAMERVKLETESHERTANKLYGPEAGRAALRTNYSKPIPVTDPTDLTGQRKILMTMAGIHKADYEAAKIKAKGNPEALKRLELEYAQLRMQNGLEE